MLKSLGFYGMNRTEKWLMAQGFELEFGRRRVEERKGWLFAKWKVFEEFGRLVDFGSAENKEKMEEVRRIEEEVREIEEGTVYRTGGQFGLMYEEFCRFNEEFIAEVKEMGGREGDIYPRWLADEIAAVIGTFRVTPCFEVKMNQLGLVRRLREVVIQWLH